MSELLTAVAIIFIVAGPFLLAANRFGLPIAPALIFAGLVAGVFIEDEALTLDLARFGIALLVFSFGVQTRLADIEAVIADSEWAAIGQIVVMGTLGLGFGVLVGLAPGEAVYLGVAAALSSTLVATSLLRTEIRADAVQGRLGQSIQFVQDIFAIGFILLVSAGTLAVDPIVLQIGYGAVFLLAAVAFNRYAFDALAGLAGGSDELVVIGIISLLVVFMGAASATGVPIVVGAFAAGLAVRHDLGAYLGVYNGLESITTFFLAIFFVTVGMLIVVPFVGLGPAASIERVGLVAGLVTLTVLVKPVVTTALIAHRGYEARTSVLVGLSTDQVSEFAVIIAIEAALVGLVSQAVFDAIILAAAVTMTTSAFTYRHSESIYRLVADRVGIPGRHDKIDVLSNVPSDIDDHVIILGYGRQGRHLVRFLEDQAHPYVVIENDPARHVEVAASCQAYVLGDGMEPYTWEKANATDASVIVSLTNAPAISRRLLKMDLGADLVLRARDASTALELLEAGATYVAVTDLLAGEQLTGRLEALLEGRITPDELRSEGLDELDRDG